MSAAYRRYVLVVVSAVYGLNLVDRGLMQLLLQPIKDDLQLSDSQAALVTGIAFALFYATLGLPIARWADRGNRASITALAIGLWGLTVMGSVFVSNFASLLLARMAAAVGEAGCKPPTYSLVGTYFREPAERTRAMTVYWLGAPLAALVSYMAGGRLNEAYGWRLTFFIMGIPGLALAVLVALTIKDPRRSERETHAAQAETPSLVAVLVMMWRQRTLRHLSTGLILLYTIGFGMGPWYAAFLMRSHGMRTSELGVWLGLLVAAGAMAGVLAGGFIVARWFGNNERSQLRTTAMTAVALVPCFIAFLLVPQTYQALVALAVLMVAFNFFYAPSYALMQRLVPDAMRATTLAVMMLLANLIGMGVGPQIVGSLSDALRPELGSDSLRYAMLTLSIAGLWAARHFWLASRTVAEDLAR